MKNVKKILYAISLAITIFVVMFFFSPQKAEAKAKFGYRHPGWPLKTCDTSYPFNCAVVSPD